MTYISWQLLRFLWLGWRRKKATGIEPENGSGQGAGEPMRADEVPSSTFSSAFYDGKPAPTVVPDERPEPRLGRVPEPDASEFGFDALLEMRQMRNRFDDFLRQHEALRAEVDGLRDMVSELRAASQVSPVYSEAVTLARRGYDAQVIADRCGISVAEAELVRSLTKDSDEEADNA